MRNSNISREIRITAIIVGFAMLALLLFSSLYIIAEADHDCVGEDCHVCACIRQCESMLRQAGSATESKNKTAFFVAIAFIAVVVVAAVVPQKTPISAKVRLND